MNDDDLALIHPSILLAAGTVKAFAADLLKNEVVLKIAFHLREDLLALQEPMSEYASTKTLVDVTLRSREMPARKGEHQLTLGEALAAAEAQGAKPVNLRSVILAETVELPPIPAENAYQYVVAGNGLFIRAEDSRLQAMVLIAPATLHGLAELEPYAELKLPPVPQDFLQSILESARRHLPAEAMYQLLWDDERGEWRCVMPETTEATPGHVDYEDQAGAVMDLHSHGALDAFFSEADDKDEQGLRFYAVIGNVDDTNPDLLVRVGVYGHREEFPAAAVFAGIEPLIDLLVVDAGAAPDAASAAEDAAIAEASEVDEDSGEEIEADATEAAQTDTPGEVVKSPVGAAV